MLSNLAQRVVHELGAEAPVEPVEPVEPIEPIN